MMYASICQPLLPHCTTFSLPALLTIQIYSPMRYVHTRQPLLPSNRDDTLFSPYASPWGRLAKVPPRTRSLLDNHAMRNRSEPALSHSHPSAVRTACARHQRMPTHPQATEHAYAPRSVYCLHYLHLALHHSSCILRTICST